MSATVPLILELMYPRKVVDEALRLHAQGWTDRQIANAVGVSIWTVRHWRTGRRRHPTTKAGRTTYCPPCSGAELDKEAYAYLLGLYLGDGHIVRCRKGVFLLCIFCTAVYPDLIEECRTAMGRVFPVSPGLRTKEGVGMVIVRASSKHWPCIFPQHGPGHKHSRPIILQPWQAEIVQETPQPLIRGLFHSDGCRVANKVRRKVAGDWKHYAYPRYFFSNTSQDIHDILGSALDLVGAEWKLNWKKPSKEGYRDPGVLSVAKRDSVALLDTFIGPKS
ncbi:helix-turn-helix domain-containing protein [Nocardiopsis baichengensis]|uniref:helix-turn-helix domain-containing protein n=1 Tax=Nocardiopsis baichengensis TaxID=280240 RepID=UPI00036FEC1C|nr:helix-turn-helix domain-containing protein [Nocardiopsis baichengensis]